MRKGWPVNCAPEIARSKNTKMTQKRSYENEFMGSNFSTEQGEQRQL
jgi:hypothetical protein